MKGEEHMFSLCEIQDMQTRITLAVRTRTSVQNLPQTIGKAYTDIAQYLGEMGTCPGGPPFVIYYNMDMQDLDVEIGFPVTCALPGMDEVQPGEIPGGKAATCFHDGPYSEMSAAYEALSRCILDNGLEAVGVAIEVYLNSPLEVAPEELKPRLSFP